MALRRPKSPFGAMKPKLHGLEPEAAYELRDADTGATSRATGKELLEEGFSLAIDTAPGSKLVLYKRVEG